MSAGESAYDVARRQREKAERLQRSAELWERGAEGEVAVARALEALPEGWIVLHDLAWPGRQRANLDHVVIGPTGVFVVDAKKWSGRIEVRDGVLRQNGRQRESTVSSAAAAAVAVKEVVSPHPCAAMLCFVQDEPLVATSRQVQICSTANLVTTLTSGPSLFTPDDVRRCAEAVERAGVRPLAPLSPAKRAAPRSSRRRKSHPVAALVGLLALLAAITSGGLQRAADWAGEQFAGVIMPDTATDPAAPPGDEESREKRRQDKADR